jgi:hypothetical protein
MRTGSQAGDDPSGDDACPGGNYAGRPARTAPSACYTSSHYAGGDNSARASNKDFF